MRTALFCMFLGFIIRFAGLGWLLYLISYSFFFLLLCVLRISTVVFTTECSLHVMVLVLFGLLRVLVAARSGL